MAQHPGKRRYNTAGRTHNQDHHNHDLKTALVTNHDSPRSSSAGIQVTKRVATSKSSRAFTFVTVGCTLIVILMLGTDDGKSTSTLSRHSQQRQKDDRVSLGRLDQTSPQATEPNRILDMAKKSKNDNRNDNHQQLQLKFSDISIDRSLGHGGVAQILFVSLPSWVYTYEAYNVTRNQKMIMKVIDAKHGSYGNREIEAFSKMNEANPTQAREIGVLPLIFSAVSMPNPFHKDCDAACAELPKQISSEMRSNLRAPKLIDVEVLPFAERRLLFSEKRSIDDYVIFLRSLLEQLDWAHKLGVNCQDLNPYTNYYVRPSDGGAVLFDWNGYTKVGEHAYHPSRSLNMCPPEGMAQRLGASDMLMYAAHVVDVWQVGLLWAHILYYPCAWATKHYLADEELLRRTILAIGGNSTAPRNNDKAKDVNMAALVGLDAKEVATLEFEPLLTSKFKGNEKCRTQSWFLTDDTISKNYRDSALDLLKRMLALSPYERPTCDVLLQHPFLNNKRRYG